MNSTELIKEFEKLQDENEHGKAIQLVCGFLFRPLDVRKMEHINALQELYGELTPELLKLRADIWDSVKKQFYKIRHEVNIEEFLKLNNNKCKDLAKEYFAGDIYQAAEYLYDQI